MSQMDIAVKHIKSPHQTLNVLRTLKHRKAQGEGIHQMTNQMPHLPQIEFKLDPHRCHPQQSHHFVGTHKAKCGVHTCIYVKSCSIELNYWLRHWIMSYLVGNKIRSVIPLFILLYIQLNMK